MSWRPLALAMVVGAAVACDRGALPELPELRPVAVIDVNVGPGKPLARGGSLVVSFDRYLDPRTATRQSIAVLDGFGSFTEPAIVQYDPEARTLRLWGQDPNWLLVDQPYSLLIGVPAEGQFYGGVRALDGSTLVPARELRVPFFVRDLSVAETPTPVSFCEQVQPLLRSACASCHDGSTSGLDLRDANGIRRTALGVIAKSNASHASSQPSGLGFSNAAILAPPNAGTSLLLNKVLLRAPSAAGLDRSRAVCDEPPRAEPALEIATLDDPDDSERALLGELVGGLPMPPPDSDVEPLSLHERRLLSRWIREGAQLDVCAERCPP